MATYIIRVGDDGPVKIGRTRNIEARLASLQTAHHERLCVRRVA